MRPRFRELKIRRLGLEGGASTEYWLLELQEGVWKRVAAFNSLVFAEAGRDLYQRLEE